jgi:hypothetical protein
MTAIKLAAGVDNEAEFEQAFSSLAYAYLKNKAPKLLEHMLGFQLIDRNDDNTKAFAVFGFKLGGQWLYAPVFFINGDLKGHELLYLKDNDAFVPLAEKWVNYLMSRRPHTIGEPSATNLRDLGGRYPDVQMLSRLSLSQHAKRATDNSWVKPFLPLAGAIKKNLAAAMYKDAGQATLNQAAIVADPYAAVVAGLPSFDLEATLVADPESLSGLAKLASVLPALRKGLTRYYGPDCLHKWAAACHEQIRPSLLDEVTEVRTKQAAVQLYLYEEVIIRPAAELNDEDRQKILKDKVLIKDERDDSERSIVYAVDEPIQLGNPTGSGIYQTLASDGKFHEAVVLMSPQSTGAVYHDAYVVQLPSREYGCDDPKKIFVGADCSDCQKWSDWFESLEDSTPRKGGTYIAVGPAGQATCRFRVSKVYEDSYTIDFMCPYGRSTSRCAPDKHWSEYDVRLSRTRGRSLWFAEGRVGIPEDFKIWELDYRQPRVSQYDDSPSYVSCCDVPFALGSPSDVRNLLHMKTAELKVSSDGYDIFVRSPQAKVQGPRLQMLWHLVEKEGLHADVAADILKEAQAKKSVSYRIVYPEKKAAPNILSFGGEQTAGIDFDALSTGASEQYGPRTMANVQTPRELVEQIDYLSSSKTDPARFDNWQNYQAEDFQQTNQQIEQALQTGNRDIFDVGALGAMLKSVRKDALVERHLGTLMDAVDSLGRLLMNFYWHESDFADRYGRSDMPELEDSLRNSFESLGDLVIFLKEKTIEPSHGISELDLDDVAGN